MAVTKENESNQSIGKIQITNGDWQALSRVVSAYGLKDEADVIAFAIGILDKSNGRGVLVETQDGARQKFVPSDKLRAKPQEPSAQ
jgi:hypothetical protein